MGQEPTTVAPEPPQSAQSVTRRLWDAENKRWNEFVEVPAFYTCTVMLGGDDNAQAGNSVQTRPERFECRRITWASTGNVYPFQLTNLGNPQGSAVEITWGDEFTKFLGESPALLSALFGDSNGFLDLPSPILFQGRQSLNAKLRRITWPDSSDPAETRFDICFQGVGLLPASTGGVSGSV
jgi:hypothetical protein